MTLHVRVVVTYSVCTYVCEDSSGVFSCGPVVRGVTQSDLRMVSGLISQPVTCYREGGTTPRLESGICHTSRCFVDE